MRPLQDTVISIRGATKTYNIYKRPEDRLKQAIVPRLRRLVGLPAPAYCTTYQALRDVSFDIRRGETLGLIGRNGSGKSTLIDLLQGALPPTSGSIETKGHVVALQLGVGFNLEFTGRENVELNLTIHGMDRAEIQTLIPSIDNFAGIGFFFDQPVKTYSSGMYSRLAFATAAHIPADILLIDEVLAVGDIAFGQKCARFISDFKSRGTLVLCSHDLASVRHLCDRVVWIDGGELRMIGHPKEVCDEYQRAIAVQGDSSAEMKFGGRRHVKTSQTTVSDDDTLSLDHRTEWLKAKALDGQAELFEFDDEAAWYGQRLATINLISIKSPLGLPLSNLVGGEEVVVEISSLAQGDLNDIIMGFSVRNKSGQVIFGDNTYITYSGAPLHCPAGGTVVSRFRFQMPYLPTGEYTINCAIACGKQEAHVQQHWIDDALVFRVSSSHVAKGMCGIPMRSIEMIVAEK